MKKSLICICCPIGCDLSVEMADGTVEVPGNNCPRGVEYGSKEVTNPTRIVTSSIRVFGGRLLLVSVKTNIGIPKEKIFDVMKEIHGCLVNAPILTGDILIKDVAKTGADIVATRSVEAV